MSYAGMVNHLFDRYATDAMIAKTEEEICKFG